MSVFAAASSSSRPNKARLREIIELGREALRQRRADELAFDLLGLDGVSLPLATATRVGLGRRQCLGDNQMLNSAMRGRRAIMVAIAIAAQVGAALAGPQPENGPQTWLAGAATPEGDARGVVKRVDMRVNLLHAGADAAEVERVLGRPTTTAVFSETAGDDRVLVYADEPVRTHVRLTGGRVTEIALDLLPIDTTSLPAHARMVKPTMVRGGVLALLGRPAADERWKASGREIEQMLFTRAGESDFSVFLADGLVVDVRPGDEKLPGMRHLILPVAIPDASVGTDLRIGLNPKQAASLLGPTAWMATTSTLEGQPVLYATYHERGGPRLVSLTFTGGVLTAFALWDPDNAPPSG